MNPKDLFSLDTLRVKGNLLYKTKEPSLQKHPGNNADKWCWPSMQLPCQTFLRNALKTYLKTIL